MAQEVITRLVDDIDGGEADQTVVFSWGSAQYEIDLNDKNAEKMGKALAPYLDKARKVSRGTATSRPKAASRSARSDLQDVRAWAHSNGHQVSDRGRVPQTVLDAYDAAH
ncbi:MAG: Lsr2-like protein [Humibacillus sp.]|nr:Lsr2-like protein [Humibacillus sp.]